MSQPTTTLKRTFAAPPAVVFRAWTEAAVLEKWFLPTGFTNALCEVDPRPGGQFRVHMRAPDGQIYPTAGRYLDVREPDRLVYLDTWDDDRADNVPVQVTIELRARDDATVMTMTSEYSSDAHRDKVVSQGTADGWEMFFCNLDRLLAGPAT